MKFRSARRRVVDGGNMEKRCFKCLKVKSTSDFYRHPMMADGFLGKCKTCSKLYASKHRSKNLEQFQAYDRNRPNRDGRNEANRLRYKTRIATQEGRRREWDAKLEWAKNNRLKKIAHWTVSNSVRDGLISKDDAKCERCGSEECLQAHHEDYSKPLEIKWLCVTCHGKRHREINEARRRSK